VRYGIVADIHANLEALDAVLAALSDRRVDVYLSVGDVVGYGADPAACIDRLQALGTRGVAGNHDWAAAGRLSLDYFNDYAREAISLTREMLGPEHLKLLAELPLTEIVGDVTLAHGTLYDPVNFDYLLTPYDAHLCFGAQTTPICFVGHSHVPMAFILEGTVNYSASSTIELGSAEMAIVNPGSVGQPRDENWKAAFGVYDSEAALVTIERVEYDIETATSKILRAGLPEVLAERLWLGK
jgi:diadenosine tetraphosphatase ApaH/serine/threonine PP2A family protein phosphatase